MTKPTYVGRGRKQGVKNIIVPDPRQRRLEFSSSSAPTQDRQTDDDVPVIEEQENEEIVTASPVVEQQLMINVDNVSSSTSTTTLLPNIEQIDFNHDELTGLSQNAINNDDENLFDSDEDDISSQFSDDDVDQENGEDITEDSFVNKYLANIQEQLLKRKGEAPHCYGQGTFWYPRKMPSFALSDSKNSLSPDVLYSPRVFIWLPHFLIPSKLRCPKCQSDMNADGYTKDPRARRIVDQNDCFYLMTCNYRCTNNSIIDPITNKKTRHTYKGYHEDIISQMPLRVQHDFPAILTHRSGVSKSLFNLIRPLVQNSVGPTRISNILRELHTLNYDTLHQQYLDMAIFRKKNPTLSSLFNNSTSSSSNEVEDFSDFSDKKKFAGHIPSPGYIKFVYTTVISDFKPYMDKQMSMLSAEILKGDHSFKLPKKIGKINSVPVFNAVYTVCNEYEEICMMYITATKALSHLVVPFKDFYESRSLFGNALPKLFFTDNPVGDKNFLESTLPCLKQNTDYKAAVNVVSAEEDSLPEIEFPEDVLVHTMSQRSAINEACDLILSDILVTEDGTFKPVYIGFDTEWPVAFTRSNSSRSRPHVALIQVAHKKTVYLFRLYRFKGEQLPVSLVTLLENEHVIKLGKNVKTDLKYLFDDYVVPHITDLAENELAVKEFKAGVDLAQLSKQRGLLKSAQAGLSKLCSVILKKKLPKNPDDRISDWSSPNLSTSQTAYAALDAWVSLAMFDVIKDKNVLNVPIEKNAEPGLCVSINPAFSDEAAAFGYIVDKDTKQDCLNLLSCDYDHEEIAVVKIVKVCASGFITDLYKDVVRTSSTTFFKTFGDHGNVPFNVAIKCKFIRTSCPASLEREMQKNISSSIIEEFVVQDAFEEHNSDDNEVEDDEELENDEFVAASKAYEDPSFFGGQPVTTNSAYEVNNDTDSSCSVSSPTSRILKDIFHLIDFIPISLKHGMAKEFVRRFRDILFILDQNDKKLVESHLVNVKKCTWEEMMLKNSEWLLKRVRRYVPPADVLYLRVSELFDLLGDSVCANSGAKLFDKKCKKAAKSVLEVIKKGFVSDPADVPMYHFLRTDCYGLPIYRCVRGTNSVEGGVHMNIIRKFGSYNASPELTDCALADYRLRHNTDVGSHNRFGIVHKGHYSPWLSQSINKMRAELKLKTVADYGTAFGAMSDFSSSHQSFGIISLDEESLISYNMQRNPNVEEARAKKNLLISRKNLYSVKLQKQHKNQYECLMNLQGTLYAIVPIHTKNEVDLYKKIVESNPKFLTTNSQKDWVEFASLWSPYADGKVIFYKSPEHLRQYCNILKDRTHYYNSIIKNSQLVKKARQLVLNHHASIQPLPICDPAPLLAIDGSQITRKGKQVDHSLAVVATSYENLPASSSSALSSIYASENSLVTQTQRHYHQQHQQSQHQNQLYLQQQYMQQQHYYVRQQQDFQQQQHFQQQHLQQQWQHFKQQQQQQQLFQQQLQQQLQQQQQFFLEQQQQQFFLEQQQQQRSQKEETITFVNMAAGNNNFSNKRTFNDLSPRTPRKAYTSTKRSKRLLKPVPDLANNNSDV